MIFIIIHHIIYQVVTPNFDNRMYACVDVFLHTAVIIFVLITGYFGLRFSWHKAMLLLFQVLFYSILLGSIAHLYFGIGTTFDFFKCFFPISSNAYWFITVYFQLFFLGPYITKLFNQLTEVQYFHLLILFFVLVCWFGFLWKGNVTMDGKNVINFIFIYMLGNGVRLLENNNPNCLLISRKFSLSVIIVLSLCLIGFYFLPDKHNLFLHAILFCFKYNSPFLILLSLSIFIFFRSLSFESRFINYMAASSLSIYLIHEHPLMREIIYVRPFTKLMHIDMGIDLFFIMVVYAISLSLCCMLLDKVRSHIFNRIDSFLEHSIKEK